MATSERHDTIRCPNCGEIVGGVTYNPNVLGRATLPDGAGGGCPTQCRLTWTKPAWASTAEVVLDAGRAGGGSGRTISRR